MRGQMSATVIFGESKCPTPPPFRPRSPPGRRCGMSGKSYWSLAEAGLTRRVSTTQTEAGSRLTFPTSSYLARSQRRFTLMSPPTPVPPCLLQ